jgi:hypothetical protein
LADGLWASADFVARFVIAARSARSMKSEERLQLSLFTRLNTVEAELRVMKDSLAEMKVNQHELRRDRDEWRWRAERLLADQEGGAWWRWRKRGDAALDAAAASLSKLTVALRATLAETGAGRNDLRQHAAAWLRRFEHLILDQRKTERR